MTEIGKNYKKFIFTLISKIVVFLILILIIAITYLLLFLSTEPRSFPLINKYIEKKVSKKLDKQVQIEDLKLHINGKNLNITIKNFNIYKEIEEFDFVEINEQKVKYAEKNNSIVEEKEEFDKNLILNINLIKAKFLLLNILKFNFIPDSATLSKINYIHDRNIEKEEKNKIDFRDIAKSSSDKIYSFMKNNKDRRIEIKDINIFNRKGFRYINVPNFIIDTKINQEGEVISYNKNKIIVGRGNESELTTKCNLKDEKLICSLSLLQFELANLSFLDNKFIKFSKINSFIDLNVELKIEDEKFRDLIFNLSSKEGNFNLKNYFTKGKKFKNLSVNGKLDIMEDKIDFNNISLEFIEPVNSGYYKIPLQMNLVLSNFLNKDKKDEEGEKNKNEEIKLKIKIDNFLFDNLSSYWPVQLDKNNIKKWLVDHIKGDVLNNLLLDLKLTRNENNFGLDYLQSNFDFSNLSIKYLDDMPIVSNLNGAAYFSKKDMNIAIKNGTVLDTQIYKSNVLISDFSNFKTIDIKANTKGDLSDILAHFIKNVNKFKDKFKDLNAQTIASLDLKIPIDKNSNIADYYIKADALVHGIGNDFIDGDFDVDVIKNFKENQVKIKVDTQKAKISLAEIYFNKNYNEKSYLDFIISFMEDKTLDMRGDFYVHKENYKKILGLYLKFDENSKINNANLIYSNNDNKLDLKFENNYKIQHRKFDLEFNKVNLSRFFKKDLNSDNDFKDENLYSDKNIYSEYNVNGNRILLRDNYAIRNIRVKAFCLRDFCNNIDAKFSYNRGGFYLKNKLENDQNHIVGEVSNVGFLIEALGYSNTVLGGKIKFNIKPDKENKNKIDLNASLTEDIIIFENRKFKYIYNDNILSNIRDKIFSNNKLILNYATLNATKDKNIVKINSFYANNYKLGFTAQGEIDTKLGKYTINGSIIPGYLVNNLFGFGSIPYLGTVFDQVTGGERQGVFVINFNYDKDGVNNEAKLKTNAVSTIIPNRIKKIF